MTEKFRTDLKLIKYAFNLKSTIACVAIFAAFGFIIFFGSQGSSFLGGFFLIIVPMWGAQLISSLEMANLVQSSPRKKEMQVLTPTLINFIGMLIMYVIIALLSLWMMSIHPDYREHLAAGLVYMALSGAIVMVYTALAYKLFIISFILFFAVYLTTLNTLNTFGYEADFTFPLNFPAAFVAGVGILFIGALAQYLVSLACYRLPMSKRSQGSALKKYL